MYYNVTYQHAKCASILNAQPMLQLYITASEALSKLKADTSGATAIEYGLLAAGIPVAIIVAVSLLGDVVSTLYTAIMTEVEGAL